MPNTTCTVPECDKPKRSTRATHCQMHYYRLRRNGTLTANAWHRRTTCTAEGCESPETREGLCAMHWSRVQRSGTIDGMRPRRGGICSVDGCDRAHDSHGWCEMHARRARDNGNPMAVRQGGPGQGAAHHQWVGDAISYEGWHQRIRNNKGRASLYPCVDCDLDASDWSYDHSATDERSSPDGPYCLDMAHYEPRCRRCHIIFDARDAARASMAPA